MYKNELMELIETICKCVSDDSSEENKITVLNDIKPTSFAWVMDELYLYLECSIDPFK